MRASLRGEEGCLRRTSFLEVDVRRIQFDEDRVSPLLLGDHSGRSRPSEWIQYNTSLRASGEDARADKVWREDCEMRTRIRTRWHGPDRALVPQPCALLLLRHFVPSFVESNMPSSVAALLIAEGAELFLSRREIFSSREPLTMRRFARGVWYTVNRGFCDGVCVVVVALVFCQEENVLMASCRAIFHALGHRVWFCPHNFSSQIPSVCLECEGDSPWNSNKILWFQSRRYLSWFAASAAISKGLVLAAVSLATCGIAIPQVQPNRSVFPQHATNLSENFDHLFDVFLRRTLLANLVIDAIISQPPVGRRGHATVDALRLERAKNVPTIAL